jgi:hypothetical protein
MEEPPVSRSPKIRRTTTLAAGAAAVGLAALAFAGPAQAATATPAGTASQAHVLDETGEVNNLGLTPREAIAVQGFIKARYGYTGELDGKLGQESWMGIQRELTKFGTYTGTIDGIVDTETIMALQGMLAPPIAGYVGPIDGTDNPATEAAFALYADTLIEDDGL